MLASFLETSFHPKAKAASVKHPLVTAMLLFLLLGPSVQATQYRIVTEDWAPYNYVKDGQLTGLATHIVRRIMALTGDDFEMMVLPSMRAAHALQTQGKTIMYAVFRTPGREPMYKWVGPIVETAIHPYQLASTQNPINTLEQLLTAPRIATRRAGLIPTMLQSWGFKNLDKSASNSVQLYRMLMAGRASIIIGDTDAGVAYHSAELGIAPDALRQIPIEIFRAPLYIASSRDCDDELVAAWGSALDQLRRSGELQRIWQQYEAPTKRQD